MLKSSLNQNNILKKHKKIVPFHNTEKTWLF